MKETGSKAFSNPTASAEAKDDNKSTSLTQKDQQAKKAPLSAEQLQSSERQR